MKTMAIIDRIKEYFFVNPTAKLRVRQIEREIKVPLPSAIRYAKELEKQGILKSTIVAGVKLYSADRTSKTFLIEKKLFNIKSLFSSGLVEFLVNKYSNAAIAVFGSYAKGEDIEKSDIDLYIEMQKKEINLERFEKELKRKIQLFIYKKITDVENKELANNILNGITLNGFIEVYR
ncbi:MAG TPA: nucleotidyltransferase domain-containing protein [Candidatus Nanoarchaeia archaeon]|nr:nucleotidyltransferase domain-containing protein [Candidatus Nanoarchaeia archaeon]